MRLYLPHEYSLPESLTAYWEQVLPRHRTCLDSTLKQKQTHKGLWRVLVLVALLPLWMVLSMTLRLCLLVFRLHMAELGPRRMVMFWLSLILVARLMIERVHFSEFLAFQI